VRFAAQAFDVSTHVLREVAGDPSARHDELSAQLTPAVLAAVVELVPEDWLETTPWLPDATAVRSAYLEMLLARLANPGGWLPAVAS
jgi:hypothetical protein